MDVPHTCMGLALATLMLSDFLRLPQKNAARLLMLYLSHILLGQMQALQKVAAWTGEVVSSSADIFSASLSFTAAGSYNVSIVALNDGESAEARPRAVLSYNLTVQSGVPDPNASSVDGPGLFAAVVGQTAEFWVILPLCLSTKMYVQKIGYIHIEQSEGQHAAQTLLTFSFIVGDSEHWNYLLPFIPKP